MHIIMNAVIIHMYLWENRGNKTLKQIFQKTQFSLNSGIKIKPISMNSEAYQLRVLITLIKYIIYMVFTKEKYISKNVDGIINNMVML